YELLGRRRPGVELAGDRRVGQESADILVSEGGDADGDDTRANRRQQRARLAGGEHDRRVSRRLFQQLEEGVRGILGAFLCDHALSIADDKDLAPRERRRDRGILHDGPYPRDENALVAPGGLIETTGV